MADQRAINIVQTQGLDLIFNKETTGELTRKIVGDARIEIIPGVEPAFRYEAITRFVFHYIVLW
ncbi:hypothetical protein ATHEMM101B_14255 [Atlantibacter hermannii]|nr:Uncharacterised protein [Atlantibacter hermannii]